MPIINGRYYMNPVMGQALEAAREAETALAALEDRARQTVRTGEHAGDDETGEQESRTGAAPRSETGGPIHRIEIEAAELVPAHSGRAARGFVARVHRQPAGVDPRSAGNRGALAPHSAGAAETHVFSDHRDLVSFLRDELGNDAHAHRS